MLGCVAMPIDRLPQYFKCGECAAAPAALDCKDCSESYCRTCCDKVHSKGMRKNHTHFARVFVCQRCSSNPATVACGECSGRVYCDRCTSRLHGPRGKHRSHTTLRPVKEYYPKSDESAHVINKDEQNAFHLKVDALVASPARYARSASLVEEAAADTVELSRLGVHVDVTSSKPQLVFEETAEPSHGCMFYEPAPHEISTEGVNDRIWGWRRLGKLYPNGCLFDVGNELLATTYKYPRPLFPPPTARDVVESLGQGVLAEVPGTTCLPKFVDTRPRDIALDERGWNLALLCTTLAGTVVPIASTFHSLAHRSKGLYSFQFFEELTAAEELVARAAALGMPVSEHSPVRSRKHVDTSAAYAQHRPAWAQRNAEPLTPRQQDEALLASTGSSLNLDFLWSLFRRRRSVVTIDDIVPIGVDGAPIFGLTEAPGEEWKILLGKAFARFSGRYSALEEANPVLALRTLTGGHVTAESWRGSREIFDLFRDVDSVSRYVWWKIEAVKRVGQLVMLSHRRSSIPARSSSPIPELRDAELEDAENASQNVQAEQPREELARPNDPVGYADSLTLASPSSVTVPASWGTEDWALAEGELMDASDAAVALHTAQLSMSAANTLGIRRAQNAGMPPSQEGWKLIKMVQVGGELGAERFSYAHFSGQWTKELRDHFDFKSADPSVVFGTSLDIAEEFDTITVCSQYVGAPPSASFVLAAQPDTESPAAQQILVVLQRGVTTLNVVHVDAYDLVQGKPATKATSVLHLRLVPLAASLDAWFSPKVDHTIDSGIPLTPLVAVNRALGISETLPDRFSARHLPILEPDDSDVGSAFVLVVSPIYPKDSLSVAMGFDPSEVAFCAML